MLLTLIYLIIIEKLKNVIGVPSHDNFVLLSPELMDHCNISCGSHISIRYLDSSNKAQQFYLTAVPYESLKSILSVAFVKESESSKNLFTKEGSPCSSIRIDMRLSTLNIKSLAVQIKLTFKDPFVYLKDCVVLKRKLIHRVIHSKDEEFVVEVNENKAYKLAVISYELNENSIDEEIANLSLSDNSNRFVLSKLSLFSC